MKLWTCVALLFALPDQAYPQSSVRETTAGAGALVAAPSMELALDVYEDSRIKLIRICEHDDDLECVDGLRLLFLPQDTLFGRAISLAHLQLVDSDTGRPVKMLPQKERTFHWKAALRRAAPHYDIVWGYAHPPLKRVTQQKFRIVVEGFDEISTPPFKFVVP